jgi:hypothetical protein
MPYVIPSLRNKPEQKEEDAMRIVHESMEVHFPMLSQTIVQPKDTLAYAAKAKEWEAKREALELKERVDKRVTAILQERERLEEAEYKKVHLPKKKIIAPIVADVVEETVEVPVDYDAWTTVTKKVRKPKPEKVEEEEEFLFEYDAQDEITD